MSERSIQSEGSPVGPLFWAAVVCTVLGCIATIAGVMAGGELKWWTLASPLATGGLLWSIYFQRSRPNVSRRVIIAAAIVSVAGAVGAVMSHL